MSRSHRGGSHRGVRVRSARRRLVLALAGVAGGTAVVGTAAFVILNSLSGESAGSGGLSGGTGGMAPSSPMAATERPAVPEACGLVSARLGEKLAPRSDRTGSDTYQAGDRQNQCVWGAYTGSSKRQLTVELRAVAAAGSQTPSDTAQGTFQRERRADESGEGLLPSRTITVRRTVSRLGQEAYAIYSEDVRQGSGEATVNARVGNVLVTVHYSGGDGAGPLGSGPAIGGAIEAAQEAVRGLASAT